jgi:hypothetical protein
MSSPHRQHLPEGLAQLPPGPRLGAALAEIDPARLTATDAETYVRVPRRLGRAFTCLWRQRPTEEYPKGTTVERLA